MRIGDTLEWKIAQHQQSCTKCLRKKATLIQYSRDALSDFLKVNIKYVFKVNKYLKFISYFKKKNVYGWGCRGGEETRLLLECDLKLDQAKAKLQKFITEYFVVGRTQETKIQVFT